MNKQKFLDGLLNAAGFASALFLFLPLVVYLLNLGSVTTPKMAILLCGGLLAVVTACILTAFMLIPGLGRLIVVLCQIGLIAVLLLTVFPNRTGEMTGFVAFLPSTQNLWAIGKLFAVISCGVWLAWRKAQMLAMLSQYALIVVVLVIGYVVLVPLSAADKAARKQSVIPAHFTQLGESSNVIVIIFDSFTGYRMAEVLTEYPNLRKELDGFVYYPFALASALSTPAGVGAILTGDLRTSLSNADAKDRNADSLQNSFLADSMKLGLSAGFISLLGAKETQIPSIRENVFYERQQLKLINRFPAYLGFFSLSLSRVSPGSLTSLMQMYASRISAHSQKTARTDWELLQALQSESERRSLSGKMAFEYFVNHLKVTKKGGSVLVLHSMLTHPPNNLTSSGKYQEDNGKGYEGTSVYATQELARLCTKLKALGVYDSTLIIAVADHGAMPINDVTMGGTFLPSQPFSLEYNPLLMVKAPEARGACRDSVMSVWLGDVATTVRDFLGISTKSPSLYASRSLLQSEISHRSLAVPVFFRPDQVSYYDSLSKWIRQDSKGTFRDYGAIASIKPEKLLQSKSKVKLFVGIDQLRMKAVKSGWAKDKNIPYCGSVEVNNRLLTKLSTPGIAVVTGSTEEGYKAQMFADMAAGEAFLKTLPVSRDRLIVGMQVPPDFVGRLFPETAGKLPPKTPVGFVAVSGPSYGPNPKVIAGVNDLTLDISWKNSTKD